MFRLLSQYYVVLQAFAETYCRILRVEVRRVRNQADYIRGRLDGRWKLRRAGSGEELEHGPGH
jgi:hypothetical protein